MTPRLRGRRYREYANLTPEEWDAFDLAEAQYKALQAAFEYLHAPWRAPRTEQERARARDRRPR